MSKGKKKLILSEKANFTKEAKILKKRQFFFFQLYFFSSLECLPIFEFQQKF